MAIVEFPGMGARPTSRRKTEKEKNEVEQTAKQKFLKQQEECMQEERFRQLDRKIREHQRQAGINRGKV